MKENDKYVRFRLVTGVSKFSHTSLFSGDNNLKNITMYQSYASMLGYTQEELEKYFDKHIVKLAQTQKKNKKEILNNIMHWYNGYQFSENGEKVYNPFSTLLLFDRQQFKNYWFESGTPTFLLNMLIDQGYSIKDMEKIEIKENIFSSYDLSSLNLAGLLYETGYLTIKDYNQDRRVYTLDYPNCEVKDSFVEHLLNTIYKQRSNELLSYTQDMVTGFQSNNLEDVFDRINTILSGIPHQLFTKYEAHYHSLVHLIFEYADLSPDSEKSTTKGDCDMTIETEDSIYILEFKAKTNKGVKGALAQIKDREYAKRFEITSKKIYHVAVALDTKKREVTYEVSKNN